MGKIIFMVNFETYECKKCSEIGRLAYISGFEFENVEENKKLSIEVQEAVDTTNAEIKNRGRLQLHDSHNNVGCSLVLTDSKLQKKTGSFSIKYKPDKQINDHLLWDKMEQAGILYLNKPQLQLLDDVASKMVNRILMRYNEDVSLELQILSTRVSQPSNENCHKKITWKELGLLLNSLPMHDQHLHQKTLFMTGWLVSISMHWIENDTHIEGPFMATPDIEDIIARLKELREENICITEIEDGFIPKDAPCEHSYIKSVVNNFKNKLEVRKSKSGPFKNSHHLIKDLPGTSNLRILVPVEFADLYLDEIDQDYDCDYYPIKFNDKFRRCMAIAMLITFQKMVSKPGLSPEKINPFNQLSVKRIPKGKNMGKKINYLNHLKERRARIIEDRSLEIDPVLKSEMDHYLKLLTHEKEFWELGEDDRYRIFELSEDHPAFAMDAELAQVRYIATKGKKMLKNGPSSPNLEDLTEFMKLFNDLITAADDYSYLLSGTTRGEPQRIQKETVFIKVDDTEWHESVENLITVIKNIKMRNMYVFLLLEITESIIFIGHYELSPAEVSIPEKFNKMHLGKGILCFSFTNEELYTEDIDAEAGIISSNDLIKLRERILEKNGRELIIDVIIS